MRDDTNLLHAENLDPERPVHAGSFSAWLDATLNAEREGRGVDVPCGDCTACCSAAYFIHIGPDERETLRRIPPALLFPAPGWPEGSVVMGFDANGRCPMLVDGACSIYEQRPATCRRYDCRVFAAAGIEAGGDEKRLVNARIRRWHFSHPTRREEAAHVAVGAAAAFLEAHAERFGARLAVRSESRRALVAIRVFEIFLDRPDADADVDATVAAILQILDRSGTVDPGGASSGGRSVFGEPCQS